MLKPASKAGLSVYSLLQRKKTTGRAGMLPDSFSFKSLKK
jgi:hypothetical protein